MLCGKGGQQDEVDICDLELGRFEGLLAGGLGEIRRHLARRNEAPLADAGTLLNPLVAGVHQLGQLVVADDAIRHAHTRSDDFRSYDSIHRSRPPKKSH